jgi:hypothetical protein
LFIDRQEFEAFRAEALPHLPELMADCVQSTEFDELIVDTVRTGVLEPENHEELIERSRAHTRAWAADRRAGAST